MAPKRAKAKGPRLRKPQRRKATPKPRTKNKKIAGPRRRPRKQGVLGPASPGELVSFEQRGLGARSAGQSGDTQGLSASPAVDSESVEELAEEGQAFEAEVLEGVEGAADPDQSEVFTREVAEDDVPGEYLENS